MKIFAAQLNGGGYDSMSDQMKFIILSVKNEELEKDRKEIKFLYNGKIYTTWLAGDIKVLVIKND